jgi:UDP-glucose 4-epimerase
MKILVIGGAGFLGSNLVRRCVREGNSSVTVLDSLEPRLRASTDNLQEVWDRIRFIRGSICDEPLISEVVQGQDVIFNCAAQTSHQLSLQDPLFDAEINCIGNLKFLEAVRHVNPGAVVLYSSSSTVVGRAVGDIIDEEHGEKPLDIYSANKGVAEKYYRIYNRVHDVKTVVLRFANLYGPYGKGFPEFGFVNYFISLAWNDGEIKVFGTGAQTRNVMYIDDAVDILYRAAEDERLIGDIFFAAHDEQHSVYDIAREIISVFGRGRLTMIEWPEDRKRIEVENVRISSGRLREVTGWSPRYSLSEGLQRTKEVLSRMKR